MCLAHVYADTGREIRLPPCLALPELSGIMLLCLRAPTADVRPDLILPGKFLLYASADLWLTLMSPDHDGDREGSLLC